MKKIIFGIIVFTVLGNSCKKPIGNEYCTWTSKTIGMNALLNCNENDSCKFDTMQILLKFDTKYIDEFPPCGSFNDSVIGNIKSLDVNINYLINNDTLVKNINDIINFEIKYFNNEMLANKLNYISTSHPRCNSYIYLYLTNYTDTTCLQFFTIEYQEIDGATYVDTTNPIYITP